MSVYGPARGRMGLLTRIRTPERRCIKFSPTLAWAQTQLQKNGKFGSLGLNSSALHQRQELGGSFQSGGNHRSCSLRMPRLLGEAGGSQPYPQGHGKSELPTFTGHRLSDFHFWPFQSSLRITFSIILRVRHRPATYHTNLHRKLTLNAA